jgi:hypothetical protein
MGPQGVGSLEAMGSSQQKTATQGLGQASNMQTRRNAANLIAKTERAQGMEQLGGTIGGVAGGAIAGAEWGSAVGPWGTLIGGVVGAIAGRFM